MTVHSPIAASDGDLELALRGSFLPIPPLDTFEPKEGEVDIALSNIIPDKDADNIIINVGRPITRMKVTNLSDRAIQVDPWHQEPVSGLPCLLCSIDHPPS